MIEDMYQGKGYREFQLVKKGLISPAIVEYYSELHRYILADLLVTSIENLTKLRDFIKLVS